MEERQLSKARRRKDLLLRLLLWLSAGITCALLAAIIGYILVRGLPHVTWRLVTTTSC